MSYPEPRYLGDTGEASASYRPNGREHELTYPSGVTVDYLAVGASTDGEFGLYRWNFGPNETGPGPHFHRTISESFYILAGTVRLYDGQRWVETGPGDFLYVRPGGIHGFKNVTGGTITSSPGPMPRAASEVIRALVPFAVARQPLAPVSVAYACSNAATCCPRNHLPLRTTPRSASSSRASATGHDGNGVRRTGAPPSSAGPDCAVPRERARVAVARAPPVTTVPMNLRRVTCFTCFPRSSGSVSPSRFGQPVALSDDDLFDVFGERSRASVVDHRVAPFVPALAQHTA